MNNISLILTSIMSLLLVVIIAPNIFAANRGNILRNIAIWLAVFVALGLIYQNFGPGSPHPLFRGPAFSNGRPVRWPHMGAKMIDPATATKSDDDAAGKTDKPDNGNDGAEGFTPPKE